jgi:hypothetical protein
LNDATPANADKPLLKTPLPTPKFTVELVRTSEPCAKKQMLPSMPTTLVNVLSSLQSPLKLSLKEYDMGVHEHTSSSTAGAVPDGKSAIGNETSDNGMDLDILLAFVSNNLADRTDM